MGEIHGIKKRPPVCKDCWRWKEHKGNCWFIWEEKRICTKWGRTEDEEKFRSVQ